MVQCLIHIIYSHPEESSQESTCKFKCIKCWNIDIKYSIIYLSNDISIEEEYHSKTSKENGI